MTVIPRIVECCGLTFGYTSRNDLFSLQLICEGIIVNPYYGDNSNGPCWVGLSCNEIIDSVNSDNPFGITLSLVSYNGAWADGGWFAYGQDNQIYSNLTGYISSVYYLSAGGDQICCLGRVFQQAEYRAPWQINDFPDETHFHAEFLIRITISR